MIRVAWEESALNELANLWNTLDSPEKAMIQEAMNRLEDLLKISGDTAGESRHSISMRVHTQPPLGAMVKILFQDRQMMAKIIQVWPIYKFIR